MSELTIQVDIEGVDKVTQGFRQMGEECENMGKRVNISARQLITGFSGMATSAFSLYNVFDRVYDMQVSVDRANLQLKTSAQAVDEAQRRYNAVVEKYGYNSAEAKKAAEDLSLAQERYKVAAERAQKMQGDLNEVIAQGAIQIIPTTITMVDNLSRVWNNFPDITGLLNRVSKSVADVGSTAKTAAIGVGAFAGSFAAVDTILSVIPDEIRDVAAALTLSISAITAATVAWLAYHGTITVGVAVPIILAAVGAGIASIKAMLMGEGGIVTKPTIALIGEREPEAVIPLSKVETFQRTVNITNYVTIEGPVFRSRGDMEYFVDRLKRMGLA